MIRRLTSAARPSSPRRSGYTLFELLLVLAVLGVIASVAWPSVLRMQADHELAAAVEQVRMQLASARTRAIHSGLAYQFRYEPNGRRFCTLPFEAEPELTTMPGGTSTSPPVQTARSAAETSKSVRFLPSTGGEKLPAGMFQGLPDAGNLASAAWSAPLIFAPDGSAVDAVIALADRRGQRVDIAVRGLTGAVTVGPMHRGTPR
jgi:type II secretion system protein H